MGYLYGYDNFSYYLMNERLHINEDIEKLTDIIYNEYKKSNKNKLIFDNIPPKLNIKKIIIKIHNIIGYNGYLDIDKSKETKDGWVILIHLKPNFEKYTLGHELNHMLRLTLIGKETILKELNHIKTGIVFNKLRNSDIDSFFEIIYMANNEEINSKIMEFNIIIKDFIKKSNIKNLNSKTFKFLLKNSEAYKISNILINFNCDKHFKNISKNELNKFFYLFEKNKEKLDNIKTNKLKLLIRAIKNIVFNKISLYDDKIYKPKKDCDFYTKWTNKQGVKLKKRLYSLCDLYI